MDDMQGLHEERRFRLALKIFVENTTVQGNVTIPGVDGNYCSSTVKGKPNDGNSYKAFLASNARQPGGSDWIMYLRTNYIVAMV